ncbi:MAG: GtrA family protein [Clostridia bacterium]|nr:GtrA family protein [Clostridia bacterium]
MKDKKEKGNEEVKYVEASDVFIRKSQLTEFIRYLIVGFSVTIITLILIGLFNKLWGIERMSLSNAVACLIMIFVAFVPYKIFVFRSRDWGVKNVGREFVTFFSARAFTFFFDLAFIWLAVDILKFNADYPVTILRSTAENPKAWEWTFTIPEEWIFKFISMVVTTIANYIFSKFVIFAKKDKKNKKEKTDPAV